MKLIDKVRDMSYSDAQATVFGWCLAKLLDADHDAYTEANEADRFVWEKARAKYEKEQMELAAERDEIVRRRG